MSTVIRTHQEEVVELPLDRAMMQKVLRRHGIKGYSISDIDPPRCIGGLAYSRMYCLTRPRLHNDGTMRKQAKTVVFACSDESDELIVREIHGWVVRDLALAELLD